MNVCVPRVPVDYVNNANIASAWDSDLPKEEGEKIPIYKIANRAAIQWLLINEKLRTKEFKRLVSPLTMWYFYCVHTTNRPYIWLLTWLLHYIPAFIGDAVVTLFRIQLPEEVPSFVTLYDEVTKFTAIYNYFLTNDFFFQDHNVNQMLSSMTTADRVIFNCDLSDIDKKEFLKTWSIGIRKYIVEDGLKESNLAYKRQFYYRIANYAVMALYFYIFWKTLMLAFKIIIFLVYKYLT